MACLFVIRHKRCQIRPPLLVIFVKLQCQRHPSSFCRCTLAWCVGSIILHVYLRLRLHIRCSKDWSIDIKMGDAMTVAIEITDTNVGRQSRLLIHITFWPAATPAIDSSTKTLYLSSNTRHTSTQIFHHRLLPQFCILSSAFRGCSTTFCNHSSVIPRGHHTHRLASHVFGVANVCHHPFVHANDPPRRATIVSHAMVNDWLHRLVGSMLMSPFAFYITHFSVSYNLRPYRSRLNPSRRRQ